MPTLIQLTDFHLRPPGKLTLGEVDADALATAAIDAVIARHPEPDAVLVTGDVADLGEDDAYSRAAMLLSRFTAPVLVMPGNHDRTEPMRQAFSAWHGVSDHPVAEKICHVTEVGGVDIICLDTSVDGLDRREHHGELGTSQLEFLREVLSRGNPSIIAMHHPPVPMRLGRMDDYGLHDAEDLAATIAGGNVLRIVCGHVHRMVVGELASVPVVAIPGVAHQVALNHDPEAAPRRVMEPPAYAVHIVEDGFATSQIGYVDEFGGPQVMWGRKAEADR
ncbi:MAG: phosphodiesterase [Pseudomonadota bacterium]